MSLAYTLVVSGWVSCAGKRLLPLKGRADVVTALVMGEGCLLSGGLAGNLLEWALPDPRAMVDVPESPASCWLATPGLDESITCMEVCRNLPPKTLTCVHQ